MAYKKIPRAQMSEEERERQRALGRASNRRFHERHPESNSVQGKAYRARHHERVLAAQQAKRAADPEGNRAYQKQWRDKNIEKVRAQALARFHRYFAKNPESYRERSRAERAKRKALTGTTDSPSLKRYRERNKTLLAAKFKRYRLQNLARLKAAYTAWVQQNPAKVKARNARRRAREVAAPINDFTPEQWEALCKRVKYRCCYCSAKGTAETLTPDHLTPYVEQGSNTLHNVLPCCGSCNSRKKDRAVLKPVQPFLLLPEDLAE